MRGAQREAARSDGRRRDAGAGLRARQRRAEKRRLRRHHNSGDIIHIPGLVNVDFEDVKTAMSEPGLGVMGTAVAGDPDRANKAADMAVACPLLEDIDLSGARRPAGPCAGAHCSQQADLQAGSEPELVAFGDEHHPPVCG